MVIRTSAPKAGDKYYTSTSKGGYNKCIVRNKSTGWVLPNCVGYAYGRFMEIMGETECSLPTGNAENWYYVDDGYERGTTPKPGAVICWKKGEAYNQNDGAGHVAVVEEVKANGDIVCSNSDYYGREFYMATYTKASGYRLGSAYTFQGFIYNPAVKDVPTGKVGTPVARDTTVDQVDILATSLRARKRPELNDAVIVGVIKPGIYNVYEQRDMTHEASNGYLWYRVDDALWVASKEGDWTKFYKGVAPKPTDEVVEELMAEIDKLKAENSALMTASAALKNEVERLDVIIGNAQAELKKAEEV